MAFLLRDAADVTKVRKYRESQRTIPSCTAALQQRPVSLFKIFNRISIVNK